MRDITNILDIYEYTCICPFIVTGHMRGILHPNSVKYQNKNKIYHIVSTVSKSNKGKNRYTWLDTAIPIRSGGVIQSHPHRDNEI
jgi:hypothetical protein